MTAPHYQTESQIDTLVLAFINHTLPKEQWTHAAHLTVAIWHVRHFDLPEAICLVRSRIITYNVAVGTENTGKSGYHETITIFWMIVTHFFMQRAMRQFSQPSALQSSAPQPSTPSAPQPGPDLAEICNSFLSGQLADRGFPFYFYTRDFLLSSEARSKFLPADLSTPNETTLSVF